MLSPNICTGVPSLRNVTELSGGPNVLDYVLSLFSLMQSPMFGLSANKASSIAARLEMNHQGQTATESL